MAGSGGDNRELCSVQLSGFVNQHNWDAAAYWKGQSRGF